MPRHDGRRIGIMAPRKTVAGGSGFDREAQLYWGTAGIAGRKCNAQQVVQGAHYSATE